MELSNNYPHPPPPHTSLASIHLPHSFLVLFLIGLGIYTFKIKAEKEKEGNIVDDKNHLDDLQRNRDKNCFKFVSNSLKSAFSNNPVGISGLLILMMIGWIVMELFTTNNWDMNKNFLYPEEENIALRTMIYSLNYVVSGLILIGISLTFYFKPRKLDKYTIISFIVAFAASFLYYFIEPLDKNDDVNIIIKNAVHTSIPLQVSIFIYASLETFPFIIMKYLSRETYHATMISVMTIFENIGKNIASIITLIQMKSSTRFNENEESDVNLYGMVCPLCFGASLIAFFYIHFQKQYLQDNPFKNDENNQTSEIRYSWSSCTSSFSESTKHQENIELNNNEKNLNNLVVDEEQQYDKNKNDLNDDVYND